jgi:hypothetical protein
LRAGQFEQVGLILKSMHNSQRRAPKTEGIRIDFADFSTGKMENGSYLEEPMTYAFFEGFPLGQQWGPQPFGDEESKFSDQFLDEDGTMAKEWPKRFAEDVLRFRFVFDFSGESISYRMPLNGVHDEVKRFIKCVQD